ncbi:BTAD domain-containing putative transcriptional regulator [Nocardia sp. NPDC051570]|uniref:BTAD domain-containing putative transcriptional regulator n=1 Tax=Nocardia sp. NPDC051570 TaxID=3364324 RepID=UPI003797ACED
MAHRGVRRLDMGPPRQRAVLALLTIHSGAVVSTERITEEIWGGRPPGRSTATLQTYVSRLRRLLTDALPRDGDNPVEHRAPGYLLTIDRDHIDAHRFEIAVATGLQSLRDGRFATARQRLVGALELWQGTPYAELSDYRFAADEAARLEHVHLAAVTGHAEAALALGHHEAIIAGLAAGLRRHPLHEPMVWQLMLALYRSGRQVDALHIYERTRRRLAEELGIDPGDELRSLHGAILRHDPALQEFGAPDEPITIRRGEDTRPRSSPPNPEAFAGRDEELHRLERAATVALHGCGRTIVVAGEPGIGKTRLLSELDRSLGDRGVDVVWGSCVQADGAPTHWVWDEVLRRLAVIRPEAFRRAVADSAPLLPDYLSRWESGTTSPRERFRVHDAVCRVLLELASQRPLTIILDDLHWADPRSLELLQLLAGRVRDAPLLVVVSARDTEPDFTPRVRETLGSVLREFSSDGLRLLGISPAAVGTLAGAITGREMAEPVLAALYARTNGNPFFLTQLFAALERHSPGDHARPEELLLDDVPFGLREVLHRQLSRLDAGTLELLGCCTVIGADIPVSVLARVYGADRPAHRHVEMAMRANLLEVDPERIGVLRFTNTLVLDVLYGELMPHERALLHARAAEALAAHHISGDEQVEQIAYHSWRAAGALNPVLVLNRLVAAADSAEDRRAHDRAETWLRRALEVTRSLPSDPAITESERALRIRLARLSRAADEPAPETTAAAVAERPRQTGGRMAAVLAAVGGAHGRGLVRHVQGDITGALAEFTAAIRYADRLVRPDRVGALRRAYGQICRWLLADRTTAIDRYRSLTHERIGPDGEGPHPGDRDRGPVKSEIPIRQ